MGNSGNRIWFSANMHGVNCRNATYKEHLGTTPHKKLYGKKKDVSRFRPNGCRGYMHQNEERRAKGRGALRALEVINLGLATNCNTSGYKLLVEETGKILISNQVRFDETFFPKRNRQTIDYHLTNITEIDVVTLDRRGIKWISYDSSIDLNDFKKLHSGGSSNSYILLSMSDPDLYMGGKHEDFFKSLLSKRTDEPVLRPGAGSTNVGRASDWTGGVSDWSASRDQHVQAAQELSRCHES